jgi:hypothetical protein
MSPEAATTSLSNLTLAGKKVMSDPNWLPLYRFDTRLGPFFITRNRTDGRYHVFFNDQSIYSFPNAARAAADLSCGACPAVGEGVDPGMLGIPGNLSGWQAIR